MSTESVANPVQEKDDNALHITAEPTTEHKNDLALTATNASETQYPPMRKVIVITIAMYLAMFLVALVRLVRNRLSMPR